MRIFFRVHPRSDPKAAPMAQMSDKVMAERESMRSMLDRISKPDHLAVISDQGLEEHSESFPGWMLSQTSKPSPPIPASGQGQEEREKFLRNRTSDRLRKFATSRSPILVYDRFWELPREVGFYGSPTTHLVTNIEDLTDGAVDDTKVLKD